MQEAWIGFAKYETQQHILPEVLRALPLSVAAAPGVTLLSPATPTVINIDMDMEDRDGNPIFVGASPVICRLDVMVAEELPSLHHLTYMSIALPVRKCRASGTVTCSTKDRRLEAAIIVSTLTDKEEDMLDMVEATESVTLWPRQ